jgi:hypothetical protein
LAYPLLPLLGLVPTHNLLTLLSFGLAGVGVYLLAHDLTKSRGASFVAGLVFTFSPYRFAHLDQANLATMEWLPLYAFFALRYLRGGRIGYLAATAFLALWSSLDSAYYDLYLGLWTAIAALFALAGKRSWVLARRMSLLALALLLAHLPFFWLWRSAAGPAYWVGLPTGVEGQWYLSHFSADLAAYLMPNPQQPLWREWAQRAGTIFEGEWVVGAGLLPTGLAVAATLALWRRWRDVGLWLAVFWLFLILSLGPSLRWLGQDLQLNLPFHLLQDVPILREARVLSRYSVMVALAAAVLTGVTLRRLAGQWAWPRSAYGYGVAALVILFELLPGPLALANRRVPAIYYQIAADPSQGVVLDLPFGVNNSFRGIGGWNPQAMYYQTIANHPLLGAHLSRTPDRVFRGYEQMAIIGRLARIERDEPYSAEDVQADRLAMAALIETLNLGYIVVPEWHKTSLAHAYLQEVFGDCLEMIADDGQKRGYRVRRPCP